MSAFVVDTETMNRVVRAICARNRYGQVVRQFAGIDTAAKDAATKIGRLLFTLNIEAVMQRYEDCQDDPSNLPGTEGCHTFSATFRAKPASTAPATRAALVDGFKAMQGLLYQCSEGDVFNAPLYRELRGAAGEIAGVIVSEMPEYQTASWAR